MQRFLQIADSHVSRKKLLFTGVSPPRIEYAQHGIKRLS